MGVAKRILLFSFVVLTFNLTALLVSSAYAAGEEQTGNNSGTVIQQIGVKSPATDLWRAVRQRNVDITGTSQVKSPGAETLINVSGQEWRDFRRDKLVPYSIYALGGVLLVILLFRLIRGKIKIKSGRSGKKIHRFTGFQRFVHWSVAILFIILGLTGVILTLGRFGLIPFLGKEAFGVIAITGSTIHNYLGPVFAIMLVIMLFTFMKGNFGNWADIKWFLKGGGLFGGHASAGRYNGGEKAWYWLAMIAGAIVVVSGLIMGFPFFGLSQEDIKLSQVIHAIAAIGLLAVSFGHIFMGTFAMEGAFEAMQTGYCDENWAKEHHDLWYEDLRKQGLLSVASAGAVGSAAVAGGAAASAAMLRGSHQTDVDDNQSGAEASGSVADTSIGRDQDVQNVKDEEQLRTTSNNTDSSSPSNSTSTATSTSASKYSASDANNGPDNLKMIEGVGPKIESLLQEAGLMTFTDVKNSTRDEIKAILDEAGPRYRMHEPQSWPEQAALAEKGAWDALNELQDRLNGGR